MVYFENFDVEVFVEEFCNFVGELNEKINVQVYIVCFYDGDCFVGILDFFFLYCCKFGGVDDVNDVIGFVYFECFKCWVWQVEFDYGIVFGKG